MKSGKKFTFALVAAAGFWATLGMLGPRDKPLDVFSRIPSFQMEEILPSGVRAFARESLDGKPWLADFIFTHCEGPCPLLSSKMADLQKTLPPETKLVTFTVDPQRDTPEALREYAARFGADPARWVFLRGTLADMYKLMFEGFRLPLAVDKDAPSGFRVTHSAKIVLVDGRGRLRGYYDSTKNDFKEKILEDLRRVSSEKIS